MSKSLSNNYMYASKCKLDAPGGGETLAKSIANVS